MEEGRKELEGRLLWRRVGNSLLWPFRGGDSFILESLAQLCQNSILKRAEVVPVSVEGFLSL